MPDRQGWRLILHGGAKTIPPRQEAENRAGLQHALAVGRELLGRGGSAVDTVEAVVRKLEELPTFNAGIGSVKNAEGKVELDASIMDGATLDIGAVAGLQGYAYPVSIARALLREKAILLVGDGAHAFAEARGAEKIDPESNSGSSGGDTVGCVARDREGNLAVATSTGGLEGAVPGRVGDVPLPGCGFYADNRRGAISLSGEGEAIARMLLAAEALRWMCDEPLPAALSRALDALARVGGEAGIIAISPTGEIGWSHNSSHFAVAFAAGNAAGEHIYLRKSEVV